MLFFMMLSLEDLIRFFSVIFFVSLTLLRETIKKYAKHSCWLWIFFFVVAVSFVLFGNTWNALFLQKMFCISSYIGEYNANAIAVTTTMQAECQRKVAHFRFVFVCHDACQYLLSVWFGLVCWYTFFFVHVLLFANDMCTAHNVQNYERYVVTQLTDINPLNCCDGIQNFFLPSYGCYACGFDMSCKFFMKNGTSSERDKQ